MSRNLQGNCLSDSAGASTVSFPGGFFLLTVQGIGYYVSWLHYHTHTNDGGLLGSIWFHWCLSPLPTLYPLRCFILRGLSMELILFMMIHKRHHCPGD